MLQHEIVHALRDLGAISEDEWEILAARARDDWIDAFGIRERYAGEPEEIVIEEAVAEAWRRWSESRLDAEERTSWLFARIARLIETIREAFRGRGARTVEDVFQAINRGERPVDPARAGSVRQADDEPGLPEVDWSGGVLQGAEKRPWLLDKDAVPQVEIGRLFPHLSRNDAQRAMLQWGRNNIQNFNIGQKSYFNRDTQWNVVIERQGLKHGIMYTGRARHNFELAPALPELLENAVRFETEGVRRSERKRNRGVVAVHHFAASARLDGQQLWVRLTVKEKREGTSYYDHISGRLTGPITRHDSSTGMESGPELHGARMVNIRDVLRGVNNYRDGTPILEYQESWKLYDRLREDWNDHVARAAVGGRSATPDELVERMKAFAERPHMAEAARAAVERELERLSAGPEERALRAEPGQPNLQESQDLLNTEREARAVHTGEAGKRYLEGHDDLATRLKAVGDEGWRTFTEAERQAAFAVLRAELDAIGAGAVGLRLTANLADETMGRYARGVIDVALAEPGTMRSVLRHEIVHALRDLRALSDGDWEALAARARDEWLDAFDIRTRYADRPEEAQIEEAVAEAYRRWSENRLETGAQVSWLFARIARLLEKIREAFRGARTAEDVFRAIDRGERPVDPERAADGRHLQERLERLNADWKERSARADAGGVHVMYLDGHAEFVERMKAIRAELDEDAGRQIDRALDYLEEGWAARRRIDEYVAAADRNDSRRTELFAEWERSAAMSIRDVPSYASWRAESERLLAAGRAILADAKTYGPHLAGGDLVSWTVREVEEAHERDDAIRKPLWPDGASRLASPGTEFAEMVVADPADLVRGDVFRWTETVEAGPWSASPEERTIEAVVEDIAADGEDAGKDGIGLLVRQAGGVRPPETGERIFRLADALAHCRRDHWPDEEARRRALREKEAGRRTGRHGLSQA